MTCPNCKTENLPSATVCWSCGTALPSSGSAKPNSGVSDATSGARPRPESQFRGSGMAMQYSKYKVVVVEESGLSTLLVGSAKLPLDKIEKTLNQQAKQGWQVVFQLVEQRRFLLFWTREAMIVTFGHV